MSSSHETPPPTKPPTKRRAPSSKSASPGTEEGASAAKVLRKKPNMSFMLGEYGLCDLIKAKYGAFKETHGADIIRQVLESSSAATGKDLSSVEDFVRFVSWIIAVCLAAEIGSKSMGAVEKMTLFTTRVVKHVFAVCATKTLAAIGFASSSSSASSTSSASSLSSGPVAGAGAGAGAGALLAAASAAAAEFAPCPLTSPFASSSVGGALEGDKAWEQYQQLVGGDPDMQAHAYYLAPLAALLKNDRRMLAATLCFPDPKSDSMLPNAKTSKFIDVLQSRGGVFDLPIRMRQTIELAREHSVDLAFRVGARIAPWCIDGAVKAEECAREAEVVLQMLFQKL
jgi:hypothetical protein